MYITMKENNGGGLQIEEYYSGNKIKSVVTGLEYTHSGSVGEFVSYGTLWGNNDVGGNITGYDSSTAHAAVDNHPTTNTIADYDGRDLILYISRMGAAGKKYFGII